MDHTKGGRLGFALDEADADAALVGGDEGVVHVVATRAAVLNVRRSVGQRGVKVSKVERVLG